MFEKMKLITLNIVSMKSFYKYLITLVIVGMLIIPESSLYAGNKDRAGQAGASELLIRMHVNACNGVKNGYFSFSLYLKEKF